MCNGNRSGAGQGNRYPASKVLNQSAQHLCSLDPGLKKRHKHSSPDSNNTL